MSNRNEEPRAFCTRCFADDQGGSWGIGTVAGANHCFNCGAGGSCVPMPAWAVEDVRRNASWVGKRYYPHDEDRDMRREREALLGLVTEWPGRKVTEYTDRVTGETFWNVEQTDGDKRISTLVSRLQAATAADAMRMAVSLPYAPRHR